MKYPDDFKPFSGALCSDEVVNGLLNHTIANGGNSEQASTANILVDVSLGHVHIYQQIAEAEIKPKPIIQLYYRDHRGRFVK